MYIRRQSRTHALLYVLGGELTQAEGLPFSDDLAVPRIRDRSANRG